MNDLRSGSDSACAARVTLAFIVALAATGCQRETRYFEPPTKAVTPPPVRLSQIQPGAIATNTALAQKYEDNAYALSEGQRLFRWYNCNGCHANGGGDKGPALMDNVWIYGSEPAQIYSTIVEGRPNGMPSFGGHIPENQVWELVAYVRSLSGLVSDTAAPNRTDTMQVKKPESNTEPQKPVVAVPSSASERP
ncbi:MAG TPA: c-type cytochrome [Casimicrobiaceae bacterium]|nr:c-type cytochrome [Casimicrobiaceae bacterium]